MLEIEKMMTISTAHISLDTNNLLIRAANPAYGSPLTVYFKDDCGFFIFVPEEEQLSEEEVNIPDDLALCLKLAKENGCSWLCLDCDGSEAEGMETYEW